MTNTCEKIFEFRRGVEQATIKNLVFSVDSCFVLVSSDTSTIHLYAIQDPRQNRVARLWKPISETMNDFLNFCLTIEGGFTCTFLDANHILITGFDGTYHKYVFNTIGSCERDEYDCFLDGIDGTEF